MTDKRGPTEKELQDLAKKVDKLVKKTEKLKSTSASSSTPSSSQEATLQQLRQMMKDMAMLEQSDPTMAGRKSMTDHKFWNTQPVPSHGTLFCLK